MSQLEDTTSTLFVSNFDPKTRAKTLAYEFERYGPLIRLDIPAPKSRNSKPFAFVEFEEREDAKDALDQMNGMKYKGYTLRVTWARSGLVHHKHRRERSPPRYERRRSRSPN